MTSKLIACIDAMNLKIILPSEKKTRRFPNRKKIFILLPCGANYGNLFKIKYSILNIGN